MITALLFLKMDLFFIFFFCCSYFFCQAETCIKLQEIYRSVSTAHQWIGDNSSGSFIIFTTHTQLHSLVLVWISVLLENVIV